MPRGFSGSSTRAGTQRNRRSGAPRMFASVVPGLAPLVIADLEPLAGVHVTDVGFDGRSDLILFEADQKGRSGLWSLRTVEDLFVEVGRSARSNRDSPEGIAREIWRPELVEKALSVWSQHVRPLKGAMTYRVITRVLQERAFLRTDLRRSLSQWIAEDKPKWKIADPAQIEVWISEYQPGRLIAGLRLTTSAMRQHEGREVERAGALRPTVAATMVHLAGKPQGILLDPCCGSGTILSEALLAGWPDVRGTDIDAEAVKISRQNAPGATVWQGDARNLDLPSASVSAVVSNLPFGQKYGVQGDMAVWLRHVLAEMARVARPEGQVVLLAPTIMGDAVSDDLRMRSHNPIRLLGTMTRLWVYERA
jgi:23S rRNA G2445 N2-methylase RlmL